MQKGAEIASAAASLLEKCSKSEEINSSMALCRCANLGACAVKLCIAGQADAGELPAGLRRKEVAIAGADVVARGDTGAASQHVLVAHELAVVFADGPGRRRESGIGVIRAAGPFPGVAVQLDRPARARALRRRARLQMPRLEQVGVAARGVARGVFPF